MKISVIITTFNREKWIIRSINSILNQSYNNFEIIIVDNNSTDDTVNLIKNLNNEKVRLYINDKNYERAISRNKALDLSNGDYITFLDSDDILFPNCFNNFILDLNLFGEKSLFVYSVCYINAKDEIVNKINYPNNFSNLNEMIVTGNYISNIGKFIKNNKEFNIKYSTDLNLIGIEDYEYNLRLTKKCMDGIFINKLSAGITKHISRSTNNEDFINILNRTELLIKLVNDNPNIYLNNQLELFTLSLIKFLIRQRNKKINAIHLASLLLNKYKIKLDLILYLFISRQLIFDYFKKFILR